MAPSWIDWALLLPYLASHIPIALLFDSQLLFPGAAVYPRFATDAVIWWNETTNDFVMRDKPEFVKPFIWCEMLLQLPFCVLAVYAFLARRNWIRIPSIIYGVHVATTTLPLLWLHAIDPSLSSDQRLILLLVYGVYIFFPILLALRMLVDATPFSISTTNKTKTT